jgi:hypothetical protein
VPKLNNLLKHLGFKKCIVAQPSVDICEYYINPFTAHIKNEKLYGSTRHDNDVLYVYMCKNSLGTSIKLPPFVLFVDLVHYFVS